MLYSLWSVVLLLSTWSAYYKYRWLSREKHEVMNVYQLPWNFLHVISENPKEVRSGAANKIKKSIDRDDRRKKENSWFWLIEIKDVKRYSTEKNKNLLCNIHYKNEGVANMRKDLSIKNKLKKNPLFPFSWKRKERKGKRKNRPEKKRFISSQCVRKYRGPKLETGRAHLWMFEADAMIRWSCA